MSAYIRETYAGSSAPELRLVLMGNIGCGKTTSGDTILGQLSPISTMTSPRSCQVRQGVSEGRRVTLVEAPRWYWSGGHIEASVRKETEQALMLAAPGPHGILLLVPVGQFTEMDHHVTAELVKMFGEEVLNHTLVLLTCGDYLTGRTEQEYLQKEQLGLRQMIEHCGGRYHVFNNRQRQDKEQIRTLLEKVDNMVQKNGICSLKIAQEQRAKEREREFLKRYRLRLEEKTGTVASAHFPNMETQSSSERVLERRWSTEDKEEVEDRVAVSSVTNGLHSSPTRGQQSLPELQDDITRQVMRSSSFKLNADGALLSQLTEEKPAPKLVTTFHHRINSFGERSPNASPTSPPQSPVFNSFTSSPTHTFASLSPSSSSPELRLVLLGRSGSGKSTAGNTILGGKAFETYPGSETSIAKECEKKKALVAGRRVAVVDTPDWFKTESSPDEVRAQISSCVALSSPGPHAFLLCVPVDQPAKMELQALGALETVFGPDSVQRYTLVLFTFADRLRESGKAGDKTLEEYIAGQRGDLLKLVEKCGDRFHIMETGGGNVTELLEKVDQTVKEAGGQCYTCPAFQEAEDRVRQRQIEIAKERKDKKLEQERLKHVGQFSTHRRVLYPSLQPLAETDEEEGEVREDEIEETRDEAERSVSTMNLESLPADPLSAMSPSFIASIWEKLESSSKMLPKLLADGSVWVGDGAKKVASSPMWGTVGSGAKNVHKMVIDSSVWEKIGASAGHVSKMVSDNSLLKNVPKTMADSSAGVGSGAKSTAATPVWEKVGSGAKSGAKLVANSSMMVGAGIGAGAKKVAQSPVWEKMGSGAKSGAKMVASSSMRVGAGIGAGAKKVAQSPVWGKMGSGAKEGAKMVAKSPVWGKIGTTAKKVPLVVIGGALLGLVLGVIFGGVIGGTVGAAAGSVATEVGRRKFSKSNTLETTDETAKNVERTMNDSVRSLANHGEKLLKTE